VLLPNVVQLQGHLRTPVAAALLVMAVMAPAVLLMPTPSLVNLVSATSLLAIDVTALALLWSRFQAAGSGLRTHTLPAVMIVLLVATSSGAVSR